MIIGGYSVGRLLDGSGRGWTLAKRTEGSRSTKLLRLKTVLRSALDSKLETADSKLEIVDWAVAK